MAWQPFALYLTSTEVIRLLQAQRGTAFEPGAPFDRGDIVTRGVAENDGTTRQRSPTVARVSLCLTIMALGLCLRGFGLGLGLPGLVVKYGGSTLWAAMLFFLVAIAAPRLPRRHIVSISAAIAVAVELFRLVHFPWLDSFRLTLPGALLLGRIFSPWDMLAYGVGIISGMLLDRFGNREVPK